MENVTCWSYDQQVTFYDDSPACQGIRSRFFLDWKLVPLLDSFSPKPLTTDHGRQTALIHGLRSIVCGQVVSAAIFLHRLSFPALSQPSIRDVYLKNHQKVTSHLAFP
jgi:hypothetical protein